MLQNSRRVPFVVFIAVIAVVTAACRTQAETVTVAVTRVYEETISNPPETAFTPEPEASPTPEPKPPAPKELTVCMAQEPVTLYRYGRSLLVEDAVLHGLFENDFTTLSYATQAQGLEKLPSLADGDAVITAVEVAQGDRVVDTSGNVVPLEPGTRVMTTDGSEIVFDGAPLTLPQMEVNFHMKQRFWSDGAPVTAEDSVFGFTLDADPATPSDKAGVARTASYEAAGELSTRWKGLPGFLDHQYFTRFWPPLPRHLLGNLAVADLPETEAAARLPVGDGPFKITSWVAGESIRLERNPFYYRADEGVPRLDNVTFRFKKDPNDLVGQLLQGRCDVVTHDGLTMELASFLIEAENNNLLVSHFQTGTVYEHIDFGINSWGDYGDGRGRPDWFEDVRVRRAITMCTDRERMVEDILFGRSSVMHTFVPDIHPLYPADLPTWPYDIAAANRLLDEAGYVDSDGNGIREDPASGKEFQVTLDATGNYRMNQQMAEAFRRNMLDCGIEVSLNYLPPSEMFSDDPASPLFGRRFDLGLFSWPVGGEPLCRLYASWEITGPDTETNKATGAPYGGWQSVNNTGWWDAGFDAACRRAMRALPGTPDYTEGHQEALRIFADQVPAIPLLLRLKVAAVSPEVRHFQLDPTQKSELWNLFEIDLQE
ncbi:MAG: peptide ABC transporter substrate-binding protein [Anaerolineae bacterium]